MKTDYEVEGCWSSKKITSHCRLCGKKLERVPVKGHYNSKYWELKRDDGQILVCCPNNCNVKEAEAKNNKFEKIREYCTKNSQSWSYKLDYNSILHAWIDRQGKVYPVGLRKHIEFALEHETEEGTLEKIGWLKLSCRDFSWDKHLSKRQIDTIFDYIIITGTKNNMKKFKECIDNEQGYLKIGV